MLRLNTGFTLTSILKLTILGGVRQLNSPSANQVVGKRSCSMAEEQVASLYEGMDLNQFF